MEYIPQLVIGAVLAGFAWAFKAWSATLKETSARILDKLEVLGREFHEHRMNNAQRLTKVESEVHHLCKRLDRERTNGISKTV